MSIAHYKECIRAGLKLIPLEGKRPIWKGWQHETETNRITDPDDGRLHAYEMGWQIPPGLAVIDVDKPEIFDFSSVEGCTAAQRTASGGMHYLVKIPDNVSVDFRHPWGEILQHPRQIRIYGLSEDWLRREIEPLPKAFWGNSQTNGNGSDFRFSVNDFDINELPEEGNRNIWLTQAAGHLWNEHGIHAIEKIWALNAQIGLPEAEIRGIIGQLPKWERTPPNGEAFEETVDIPETAFIRDIDLAAKDIPPIEFWDECYGPGQAVQIFGPSGCGKSYYALDRAYDLGKRTAWLDGELTWSMLKKRTGQPTGNIYYAKPEPNEWLEWDFSSYQMLVIDTKSALYSHKESENSMEHWQLLNRFISKWVAKGLCVVIIHHSGKDVQLMGRGSSAGQSIFDTIMGLSKTPDGDVCVKLTKDRHGLMWPSRYFTMEEGVGGSLYFVPKEKIATP